jgi:hypothetical protein
MLKAMFTKTLLSASLVIALGVPQLALAVEQPTKHHKHNVVDRKTEKLKTDTGFTRTTTKIDETGATATHRADVVTDKVEGTRTKTISGTTFEGKTYSGQATAHKTETGYASQGQITTSDGKVIDRSVNATVDKAANTVTKDISVTPQGGETKTHTVVHPLKKSR